MKAILTTRCGCTRTLKLRCFRERVFIPLGFPIDLRDVQRNPEGLGLDETQVRTFQLLRTEIQDRKRVAYYEETGTG